MILVASGLFTWYVASFGSYNTTYGSLGAIFGLMTWLWITSIIVIAGAELNSEVEHQTRQDTTTGKPRPMGSRGAVMADTVGTAYGTEPTGTREAPADHGRSILSLSVTNRKGLPCPSTWFRSPIRPRARAVC